MSWKVIPKIVAMVILWGAVGYVVVRVEPEILRDVGLAGLYLPFVVLVAVAVWYSTLLLSRSFRYSTIMSLLAGLTLITMIMRWMNWLIGVALVGIVISLSLTLVKKS